MRNIILCSLLLFTLITGRIMSQQNYDFLPVDQTINYWINKKYYPGAAICIVKNNQKIFQKNYGNYLTDTKVCVASAGKWVAAATIAVVVDRTSLKWDDEVEKWLSEFKNNPQGKISLRQLLSHTSGIHDYLPEPEIDTFSVLTKSVARILKLDTVFRAGSQFQYGGLAMQVAGRMAEVAYGSSFETIFQNEIAQPLGMKNSHFVPIDLNGGHAPMLGGGLQTTLNDYIQFLNMIYHDGVYNGKQILTKSTVKFMQSNQVNNARVLHGEYVEKAFGSFRDDIYGLGEWREKTDRHGTAYQISSPGWAGAYPWINLQDSVYGFFITHVEGNAAKNNGFSPFYNTHIISSLTSEIIKKQKHGDANIREH